MLKKLVSLKRLAALAAIVAAVVLVCVGCASSSNSAESAVSSAAGSDSAPIKVAGLKGPTSIGMVKLMKDNEDGLAENSYEFTLAGSADEVTPKLIQGDLDIAAVPANLAAVLYNNTNGSIKLLAINTLGVLYIVDRAGSVNAVSDLKGKTIYASGKGSTPEYSLRYILTENGLDPDKDVTIEWKSEHSEVVEALALDSEALGLLPQPFVTVAMGKVEGLSIALDLTKEWDALDNGSSLITGVLAVRSEFAEENPDLLDAFLKEYAASVDYVNSNLDDAAALCEKYGIIAADVAKAAIPYCNIVCFTGDEMKDQISGYLEVLFEANPASVGGELPEEDFIYTR